MLNRLSITTPDKIHSWHNTSDFCITSAGDQKKKEEDMSQNPILLLSNKYSIHIDTF